MPKFEGKHSVIKIVSYAKKDFDNGGSMYTLIDENNKKFRFSKTKKDGAPTRAYEGLQALGIDVVGATVGIAYEEAPDSFDDPKTGKKVEYTKRTIRWFEEVTPLSGENQSPQNPVTNKDFLSEMTEQAPDEEVTLSDIPF